MAFKEIRCYLLIMSMFFLSTNAFSLQWYDPVKIPANLAQDEINNLTEFNIKLALAKSAHDDADYYGMTEFITRALSYRPDHPDNIRLEYKMAVAMSQYRAPGDDKPLRRQQALKIYEKIADNYKHMDYYSIQPEDSDSIESPQVMIPRACIHASSLNIALNDDYGRARKYITRGLDALYETYKRRRADWLNEPAPKQDVGFGGLGAKGKFEISVANWKARQEKVRSGDVFGINELMLTEISVKNYGLSFGEKQDIGDVIVAMNEIVQKYPDSPISKIASKYIGLAKNVVISEMDEDFFHNLGEMPIEKTEIFDLDVGLVEVAYDKATQSNQLPKAVISKKEVQQPPVENNSPNVLVMITLSIILISLIIILITITCMSSAKVRQKAI